MRAKTVYTNAYVFDFDDTLVTTNAKTHLYRNGVYVKSMTPKEYNFYKYTPGDHLDISDFNDEEFIMNAKKYKMWPALQNISNAVKEDRSTSQIYILTARHKMVKPYIYEFLKGNGIEIKMEHIFTLGDNVGKINIAEEKRKALSSLSKRYDKVFFFDDDPKNIKLANSIPNIKTKLVEYSI